MIDKENKQSQLVHAGKPTGPDADVRKERRDRRRQESFLGNMIVPCLDFGVDQPALLKHDRALQ